MNLPATSEHREPRRSHDPAGPGTTVLQRLRFYLTPIDGRYEDLTKGPWKLNVFRDFTAGLIVAMVAIPLAMGFAMASGLPPEMGIVGGAVAGLVGALFGGSKYQVYGPTAAFIPVILAITTKYEGYDFLIWCGLISGVVLLIMGMARLGRIVALVPDSIVVGFTIGIATVIALSQAEQVFGLKAKLAYGFFSKMRGIAAHLDEINIYAILIAALTFLVTKLLLKVSKYTPAPLIALGLATLISSTLWADKGLAVIRDKYGAIPTELLHFTLPGPLQLTPSLVWDLCYFVVAIVFVSGVESLLCSRMADRLADNRGIPYNPNKELWGQGWVQIIVVLLNGFPHTGALARTATNIKVGAVSPLAGVFKFALKLTLAIFLARWLEIVPMACIGGILMFVAVNMVKPAEVREVWHHSRFHAALMVYTAVMVAITDFLIGVLSALAIYAVLCRFLDRPRKPDVRDDEAHHQAERRAPARAMSWLLLGVHHERIFKTLIGLSLTEPDVGLLEYVAHVTDLQRCTQLRFAHVLPLGHSPLIPAESDRLRARMHEEVEKYFGAATSKAAYDVVQEARVDELLTLSTKHNCDVIVLGHRRQRSGQRSLAKRLAMMANCSVWLVPEGSLPRLTSVLVPVDFSDHSADALSFATAIAAEQGLERCLALHVFFDPSSLRYPEHVAGVVGHEQEAFVQFLKRIDLHGIAVDELLEESTRPAEAILRVAKRQEADLIVMNTEGRSRAAAILLGSITSQTMEETHIPLLAFKHFGSRMSLLQALLHPRLGAGPGTKTN